MLPGENPGGFRVEDVQTPRPCKGKTRCSVCDGKGGSRVFHHARTEARCMQPGQERPDRIDLALPGDPGQFPDEPCVVRPAGFKCDANRGLDTGVLGFCIDS